MADHTGPDLIAKQTLQHGRRFSDRQGGALERPMDMCGLVKPGNLPQAGALCLQPLFDLQVILNLNGMRRHDYLRSVAL